MSFSVGIFNAVGDTLFETDTTATGDEDNDDCGSGDSVLGFDIGEEAVVEEGIGEEVVLTGIASRAMDKAAVTAGEEVEGVEERGEEAAAEVVGEGVAEVVIG